MVIMVTLVYPAYFATRYSTWAKWHVNLNAATRLISHASMHRRRVKVVQDAEQYYLDAYGRWQDEVGELGCHRH